MKQIIHNNLIKTDTLERLVEEEDILRSDMDTASSLSESDVIFSLKMKVDRQRRAASDK